AGVAASDDPAWRAVESASPCVDPSTSWAAALRDAGMRHAVVVPLVGARTRPLGALTFVACGASARPYDDVAVDTACELAGIAGLALDHARALRGRDDALSVVSHDLRNPLNVITVASA